MKLAELKRQTANLLILTKSSLRSIEPSSDALDFNIKNWLKKGELLRLKKGMYILKDKHNQEPDKDGYLEYLANQIVQPSYLSLEYILAKYQILSEPARTITSITTKTTRAVINPLGCFRYYSLAVPLFTGYGISNFLNSPVLTATKDKALFDYLYLRFLKNEPVSIGALQDLRLNWENISKQEFLKTYSYLEFCQSRRIKKLLDLIKVKYYA